MTQVVAIIQARMGSTRLPGKVLKPILGKPMLERMLERVKQAKLLDTIVVATSAKKADDPITRLTNKLGILSFRGSETDVLDRYYQAAKKFKADVVVRLTADCPLIDPQIIDRVVSILKSRGADYVSNRSINKTVPSGMDVEVVIFQSLQAAHRQATSSFDREHVTPFIYNHPHRFKLVAMPGRAAKLTREWHLSVDTPTDLKLVRHIYSRLYHHNPEFELRDIINLLERIHNA
jgi:spore coat polysaccharide biosynthesis protein SpsF